tara:strand:+ start:1489 stop:2622 length:1134 start_codon:yes stop_codon:yes gene_type:complete
MRILAIQTAFSVTSGGGRADYEILSELACRDNIVEIVMPRANRMIATVPPGTQVHWISARGMKIPQSLGITAFPSLLRAALRFRPQIIRDHSPYSYGLMSLWISRLLRVPIVGMIYHIDDSIRGARWVEKNLLPRYDQILTISFHSMSNLKQSIPEISDRVDYIYCGVRSKSALVDTQDNSWRKKLGISDDVPVFISSGVLAPRKNYNFLLDVMDKWFKMGRDGVLIITGEGELRNELERKIHEMGLVEKVRLVGYQSETDLVRMFAGSIAFLSPSKMEGFGLAVAEAMACGTPAIVSNKGALPEVVTHRKTGFVLPINQGLDPWISAMISLSEDSALYKSYGEAAESRIKDMFTWERAGTQTEAVYQQVVDQYHHR